MWKKMCWSAETRIQLSVNSGGIRMCFSSAGTGKLVRVDRNAQGVECRTVQELVRRCKREHILHGLGQNGLVKV